MKQTAFADSGFEMATKKTLNQSFPEEMNSSVPWASPSALDLLSAE
jgi:hypothetical protein